MDALAGQGRRCLPCPCVLLQLVMTDRNTGRPRGFGFVTFEDDAVADIVCQQKHELDGRQVGSLELVRQLAPVTSTSVPAGPAL